jgi:hypothetical protein
MYLRLALLLLIFLPVLPASGQDREAAKRTARFLFLNAPSDAPRTLQLFDGKDSREVELPRMNLSDPYALPAGPLALRLLTTAVEAPENVPAGAPVISVPATVTDAYFLVSSDPSNKVAPVRVQVVDAGVGKFKTGQTLWFNLTPHLVGGAVGTQKLSLKPRSSGITHAPATGRESHVVNLFYKPADDNRVYPICETQWLHDPRSRKLAFVFNEPGRRAPRVLAFLDHRPPKDDDQE